MSGACSVEQNAQAWRSATQQAPYRVLGFDDLEVQLLPEGAVRISYEVESSTPGMFHFKISPLLGTFAVMG